MTNYDRDKISLDYFYKNRVKIFQHRKGYRFSVDSPILADFIPVSDNNALEIGSGSGVISLLLLYLKKFPFITGIEIQKDLFELTKMSITENSLQLKFNVVNGNFIKVCTDYKGIMNIFSNPPYLKMGKGHLSSNEELRRGKFEIDIDLKNESTSGVRQQDIKDKVLVFFNDKKLELDAQKHWQSFNISRYRASRIVDKYIK